MSHRDHRRRDPPSPQGSISPTPSRSPSPRRGRSPARSDAPHDGSPSRSYSPSPVDRRSLHTVSSGQKWPRSPSHSSSLEYEPRRDKHSCPYWECHPQFPFLRHHGACDQCASYALHLSQGMALSDAGIMPAIVTLADETARLIKRTPYDDLRRRISRLERDLEETSYDLRRALRKIDDLQREPTPTIPAPTTVEQAARDFERARVASLGGRTYSSNAEASSSRLPPPLAPQPSSSSRGRVQAKPASQVEPVVSRKGKAKQLEDDTHQAAPDYEYTAMEEDTSAQQCYDDDIPMVVDTASQGTLFPEFTGEENPYRVRVLGQGRDGVRSILFVRINDNLYAYDDERLGAALANIRQGTPPPVPLRRGNLVASVTRWDRGIMGPIRLINTAEEIRKLYAEAYEEPEENAPCVRRVQELITYINLWKKCRLVTNEVMNLALKEWRPPVWASQKARQRREALRDKERARREGEALALQPAGGQPALQQRIGGQPAAPLPEMGQRPIVPLRDHLMVENPGVPQAPAHQERPPPRGQAFNPRGGGRTSGKKGKGGIPELPREAPSLEAPVADWVKFIHEYQNGYNGSDESSELSRMFPGALGVSERPDDDEWEISPPTAQLV
ncbi:hypothetical protein EDD15DRAFT_2379606 [Pisolithus albus]|nr:hypothetical protein EDD15DRAFT_2379606 [Pisolithus albus]